MTVNFVDDSTSVIAFNNTNIMKDYLTDYYNVLHEYYNANRLKLNPDKNKFIINCKPKFEKILKNFHFMAKNYKILPKKTIKILGIYIRSDLKLDTQVGKLCAELQNRIFNLKKLTKYTDFKTRLTFIKSYVIGKLSYALPLYMNCTEENITKLHRVVMSSARMAIGNYCFMKSTIYILNKCELLNIKNLIIYSSLNLYHKFTLKGEPTSIISLFHNQNIRSKTKKYRPKYIPSSKFMEKGFIFKGSQIYNEIPNDYKTYNKKKFQQTLFRYLTERRVWDSYD